MTDDYTRALQRFAQAAYRVGEVEAMGRPEHLRGPAAEEYAAARAALEEAMGQKKPALPEAETEQPLLPDTAEKPRVGPGPAETEAIRRDPRRRHQRDPRRKHGA